MPPPFAPGQRPQHHFRAYPEFKIKGSFLDLADFGPGWVFGGWFEGEELWCMAAYQRGGLSIKPKPQAPI